MKKITTLFALLLILVFAVACSSAETDNENVSEPAATAVPTEMPMEEEMAKSIVDIAVEDGRFNTLVAAVTAAGLAETLSGEGNFTVFAPTDDAFAALPEGTVDSLLADPSGALTQILLYHVIGDAVMAETVVTLDSATTLNGEDVMISIVDGAVYLNDTVQVTVTDIEASNGVVHVIDAVLIPPSIAAAEQLPTIAEIAVEAGTFNTLVAALSAANLVETFAGEGNFTVFAPTDDAFAALPEGTVDGLLADPSGALTQILLYHVIGDAVMAETVVTLDSATTLNGEDVMISIVDGAVYLNDTVQVTVTDIEASNGVVHVIDAVLIPPSIAAAEQLPTIAEIAVEAGTFNTLVAALSAATLVETFAGEGNFTVFAPTDDAFAALPEGTVDGLLADPSGALTQILLYHVIGDAVMAETVVTLDSATTLNGEDVMISIVDGAVYLNDTVQVTVTDIEASNGVVHVIDAVLIPPSIAAAEQLPTIAEIAVEAGTFNTLVAALSAANLVETFAGEGNFTVFAPTDDAFAALPEGTVDSLLADPSGALTQILLYHVIGDAVMADTVVTLDSATTLNGQDIMISVVDGKVYLNDTVLVIVTDIQASNGVVHVIDAVLIPSS